MKNIFKFLILILIWTSTAWSAVNVIVSTIDNAYDSAAVVGTWERHSKYTIQVRLYNTSSSSQAFNRVEANLDFSNSSFEFLSSTDKISGWTATNFFLVNDGHVQYQRAANTGESSITIAGNSYYTIYELEVRVKDAANLGNSEITLDTNFTHILNTISDITGTKTNLTVSIVGDSTAPVTRIQPAANTHLNTATSIILDNDPNMNTDCGDLMELHYTTDGSTPTLGSAKYSSQIALPLNATTIIKWFGLDNNSNQELPRSATYRIDTVKPTISNITIEPTNLRVKKGAEVTINFTASDDFSLSSVAVKVGNNTATFKTKTGTSYQYTYSVIDTVDGEKTINITATDHAGNVQTNSAIKLYVDNTPPTFNLNYINPRKATIGTTVLFQFTASEELDLDNSLIIIGQNSPVSFLAHDGLKYTFGRNIDGTETSGLITVRGKDLAGNIGYNLDGNNTIKISGYDLLNNYGESSASFNISY